MKVLIPLLVLSSVYAQNFSQNHRRIHGSPIRRDQSVTSPSNPVLNVPTNRGLAISTQPQQAIQPIVQRPVVQNPQPQAIQNQKYISLNQGAHLNQPLNQGYNQNDSYQYSQQLNQQTSHYPSQITQASNQNSELEYPQSFTADDGNIYHKHSDGQYYEWAEGSAEHLKIQQQLNQPANPDSFVATDGNTYYKHSDQKYYGWPEGSQPTPSSRVQNQFQDQPSLPSFKDETVNAVPSTPQAQEQAQDLSVSQSSCPLPSLNDVSSIENLNTHISDIVEKDFNKLHKNSIEEANQRLSQNIKSNFDIHSFSDIPESHKHLQNAFKSTVRIRPIPMYSDFKEKILSLIHSKDPSYVWKQGDFESAKEDAIAKRDSLGLPAFNVDAVSLSGGDGSGVIVSPDGNIATAFHVAQVPKVKKQNDKVLELEQIKYEIDLIQEDGSFKTYNAKYIKGNEHTDTASLKIIGNHSNFPFSKMAKNSQPKPGQKVFNLGYSGGKHLVLKDRKIYDNAYNYRSNLTGDDPQIIKFAGLTTVSSFWDYDKNSIEKTNTLVGGDSGGPLFNEKGEILAISSSVEKLHMNSDEPHTAKLARARSIFSPISNI